MAFSGGTDSSFLLAACLRFSAGKVLAVTVKAPYIPDRIIDECSLFCRDYGIDHHIISIPSSDEICFNPRDRCYICKKEMLGAVKRSAEAAGVKTVFEGSNRDDLNEYRPGFRAVEENGIQSPLCDCQFTKEEIREISRSWKVPVWNRPSYTCLLTRLPYGDEVSSEKLFRIEKAEEYIMNLGFETVRVRSLGKTAVIEIPVSQHGMIADNKISSGICRELRKAGFDSVNLDLEGYSAGKMDTGINTAETDKGA